MTTTRTTHPLIADLADTLGRPAYREDFTENVWHGVDIRLAAGQVLRLAAEGADPDEGITVYRLTARGVLQWQVYFSAGTPRALIEAALAEADPA